MTNRRRPNTGPTRFTRLSSDKSTSSLSPLSLLAGMSVVVFDWLWVWDLKVVAIVFALAALASRACQLCRQRKLRT